jgi:hypothetical protein
MTRECPCGGTGRRARLKIEFRKECWFDSGQGHQSSIRPHPPTFIFINSDRPNSHFGLRRRSPDFPGIRLLSWYFSWYFAGVLVSRFLGGIEPMPVKNDTYFRHLKAGEKDYKRSDSGGLFMLVTKTGSKLWRYAYSFDGKQKLLALGQYPIVSLADARARRDDAKKLLGDGVDPSVERKAERRNARMARSNTFEAVAKELMEKFKAEGDAPTTLKKKQWLLDFANKEFGKRPIAELKAPEILDALRKVEKRGRHETATRVRSTVGAVFRFAIATGRAERDPTGDLRGALITPTVTHRATIVEPNAVGALLRAINGFEGHAVTRYALRVALWSLFARANSGKQNGPSSTFLTLNGGSRPPR